jgi:hypothetical protein
MQALVNKYALPSGMVAAQETVFCYAPRIISGYLSPQQTRKLIDRRRFPPVRA